MPKPIQANQAEHDPILTRWEHAHQCKGCGHIIRIDNIDAKVIATGIVTCRKCDTSGPVNVKIVDERRVQN